MPEQRFLLVRLGSLGDIVHALPSASALRDTFPDARIDWVVDVRWQRILEGNPDISETIVLDRKSAGGIRETVRRLGAANYSCAVDFQALYKSALLPFWARVPRRIGFKSSYAREGLAAFLYISPQDDQATSRELNAHGLDEFFVLNPGGGWRSKCWPPEKYGELHRVLYESRGWRGVLTYGPGELGLAEQALRAAGGTPLVAIDLGLGPLMALLRRAKFVVSADTGPLHLASALAAPTIGLFGPTDPARNGPFWPDDVSVRNPGASVTTYQRGKDFDPAMLSITVEQVVAAINLRLSRVRKSA
jgi:heptosyltransferase-1